MILPQDQFNSFGIVHNIALDSMPSLSGFPACTAEQFYNQSLAEFNDIYYSSYTEPTYSDCETYMNMLFDADSYTTIINQLYTDGKISSNLQSSYTSLMDTISGETSFDTWDDDINSYISSVDDSDTLTDEEKMICYGGGSVALFAKYYWNGVAADPTNPYYNSLNGGLPPTIIGLLGVIGGDVIGILVGGGVGSLLGPAGAAACGAACCAACSAYMATHPL